MIHPMFIPGCIELCPPVPFVGVYFLCKNGDVVYVGQSVNVVSRVAQHRVEKKKDFDSVYWVEVEEDRLIYEEWKYIEYYNPIYNRESRAMAHLRDRFPLFFQITPMSLYWKNRRISKSNGQKG